MTEWLMNDQHNAYRQGWGLFETERGCEVQRLDDPAAVFGEDGHLSPDFWEGPRDLSARFASDAEACAFVLRQADEHDPLALKALRFLVVGDNKENCR